MLVSPCFANTNVVKCHPTSLPSAELNTCTSICPTHIVFRRQMLPHWKQLYFCPWAPHMFSLTTGLKVDSQSLPNVDLVRISTVGCIWCLYRAAALIFPALNHRTNLSRSFCALQCQQKASFPFLWFLTSGPHRKGNRLFPKHSDFPSGVWWATWTG